MTIFSDPSISQPESIAAGADGALWFTNYNNNSIGRITTDGVVSSYSDSSIEGPLGIAAGPDGALWFTNRGSIGRITTDGAVNSYRGAGISVPVGITAGQNNSLWFTNSAGNSIGDITTDGTVFNLTGFGIDNPQQITLGPDSAFWFTNDGNNSIGRVTTNGVVTRSVSTGVAQPRGIVTGPDGAVWFTNSFSNSIGRITTSAITTYTGTGISQPEGITVGPDGALWFTNYGNNSIGRITTAGVVSNYSDPGISEPSGIVAAVGDVWFTNSDPASSSIGRINLTAPTIAGSPPPSISGGTPFTFTFTLGGLASPTTSVTSGSLPPGLNLSPTGVLSGTPTATGTFGPITVSATNGTAPDATDTFSITVVASAPTISGTPPSPVNAGSGYDFAFTAGGLPVPTFSVTSGSLPPGLSLSAAGVLSGTPTTGGTFGPITVTATNGIAPDATNTFSITVVTEPPAISGTPPSPVNEGTFDNFGFTLGGLPAPTVSVTSGSLPPGLNLSPAGVLSGTPTTTGTFGPITVTATNGIAPDATDTFTISVVVPTVTISPGSGPHGTAVNVSGWGFRPGETVKISYKTGLLAPNPLSVLLCSAIAASDGAFSCTGTIPLKGTAGAKGVHKIAAKGTTSGIKATTTFTLTKRLLLPLQLRPSPVSLPVLTPRGLRP